MPLLFLYVKESACARARKALKMTSAQSFFLDVGSEDETQKRITVLPEKLSDENKSTLKLNFGEHIQVGDIDRCLKLAISSLFTCIQVCS